MEALMLQVYNLNLLTRVELDASDRVLGAVLA